MEAIIFCGIQATGKSTFYKQRFFQTHVRISMDLLRTRHRENRFLEICLETKARFVIDNTNPSREEREKYIALAKSAGYRIIGYYFQSQLTDALERNRQREGRERVPDVGLRSAMARLDTPDLSEGFDELYYVRMRPDTDSLIFEVTPWRQPRIG